MAAGCLGLIVLPWFLISALFAFISAGLPMATGDLASTVTILIMLFLFVPMTAFLGGITWGAFRKATGHARKILFPKKAAFGVGLSVISVFVMATVSAIYQAVMGWLTGAMGSGGSIVGFAGIIAFLGMVAYLIQKMARRARTEKKKRKRHEHPPPPPWDNPLARTERANMLAEAMADQYNVITLGALVALSIVLWNPLPALIGGGAELFWLALVPDSKWFRNRVDSKHKAMAEEQARERRAEQIEYLTAEQVTRHEEMVDVAESAREAMTAAQYPFDTDKVDRLVDHHLWLMELENYYRDQIALDRGSDLERQLEEVRAEHAAASGRMAEALERRIDVLERRREQLARLDQRLQEVSGQRRNLEEAVRLVAESALSSSGPQVAREIEDVLLSVEATEEVVLDFHDEEDELEQEIEEAAARVAA